MWIETAGGTPTNLSADVAQEAVKALLHFPPTESISQALHQWAEPRKAYDVSPGPSESAVLWALNRLGSGRARA